MATRFFIISDIQNKTILFPFYSKGRSPGKIINLSKVINQEKWAGFNPDPSTGHPEYRCCQNSTPPTNQARLTKMQNSPGGQPCKCGHSSWWMCPGTGDPDGHSAMECAQPDKKANAGHLMKPRFVSSFSAGWWQGRSSTWSSPARTG